MSRNTPEYRTIVKATGKLTKALMNNFVSVCGDLVANNLITPDQRRKLKKSNDDDMEKAAEVVQLLTDKVEANTANYHTLVGILKEDKEYNNVVEFLALTLANCSTPDPRPPTTPGSGAAPGQLLDQVIDGGHGGVPKHLGKIADAMGEWQGTVAENLGLSATDIVEIKEANPGKIKLQMRAALGKWKQYNGSRATYRNLMAAFEEANHSDYAETVKKLAGQGI